MKISTIVFLIQDTHTFLANKKRGFGAGYLNGYGGKKKPTDKSIEDAATRELLEEAGVKATKLDRVAIIDFFEGDSQIFECHVFFCTQWEGEPKESEEMELPVLYPLANLPFERMWHADRSWIPLVYSGQKIHATSRYNQGMRIQEHFEYVPLEGEI